MTIKGKRANWKRGELPSPIIARQAIVYACQITGASPNDVLFPKQLAHKCEANLRVSRARVYAAFALRAIFEEGQPCEIAKLLGAVNPYQFMAGKDNECKRGQFNKWWSDDAFMSLIVKIETFIENSKTENGDGGSMGNVHSNQLYSAARPFSRIL